MQHRFQEVSSRRGLPVEDGLLTGCSITELFSRAEERESHGNIPAAVALYKTWIAQNPDHELLHAVYFNYGVILNKAGDRHAAINALRECVRMKREFLPSYINLGRLLEDGGQAGQAVTQWLALVEQTSSIQGETIRHKVLALQQIGRVLEGFQQDASAEDALRQALEINAAQPEVIQHWISLRQRQCKWPAIVAFDNVTVPALISSISPLSLATLDDDPVFQLARAFKYSKEITGRLKTPLCPRNALKGRDSASRKLRIGYVSSDLREHAVGFAMTDVIESHDRRDFEIFAYYCGINRPDATQIRTKNSVDRWVDINHMSDEEAAAAIRSDGVDILVDLNGYTKDARSAVFAYRPAPVIVNWFGFPGTMGSFSHDYIIADPIVIPKGDEVFYSEKVVRLPCYQPNDRKRSVAPDCPSRDEVGLPRDAFVYCCFNGSQKLTQDVTNSWAAILQQVPKSVLWMLSAGRDTDERLRQILTAKGVSPDRLIFAEKKPNPQHLARYVLADLFLDTFPYGAHTTASDAMWMGIPVLTYAGKSFASKVCASLVTAAGIGELVCDGADGYVARAVELGRNPEKTNEIKRRLMASRATSTLFDTPLLVRDLEGLYRAMWSDAVNGTIPAPNLANLNEYFEIGLDLAVANDPALDLGRLCERYRQAIGLRNEIYPLPADGRFLSLTSSPVPTPG